MHTLTYWHLQSLIMQKSKLCIFITLKIRGKKPPVPLKSKWIFVCFSWKCGILIPEYVPLILSSLKDIYNSLMKNVICNGKEKPKWFIKKCQNKQLVFLKWHISGLFILLPYFFSRKYLPNYTQWCEQFRSLYNCTFSDFSSNWKKNYLSLLL